MKKTILFLLLPIGTFAQQSFTDARDGETYSIVQLGGLFWMTEHLRFNQEGSICLEDCDRVRFYDYAYLDSTCPEGWRLPTVDDWDHFVRSFKGVEIARMMEKNPKVFRVDFLDQFNIFEDNILGIQPYGRVEGGRLGTGPFIDFWTENLSTDARFHMHLTPYSITGHTHKHHLKANKPEDYRLFAVRCVCEDLD